MNADTKRQRKLLWKNAFPLSTVKERIVKENYLYIP